MQGLYYCQYCGKRCDVRGFCSSDCSAKYQIYLKPLPTREEKISKQEITRRARELSDNEIMRKINAERERAKEHSRKERFRRNAMSNLP
jgi:hypothetical protein